MWRSLTMMFRTDLFQPKKSGAEKGTILVVLDSGIVSLRFGKVMRLFLCLLMLLGTASLFQTVHQNKIMYRKILVYQDSLMLLQSQNATLSHNLEEMRSIINLSLEYMQQHLPSSDPLHEKLFSYAIDSPKEPQFLPSTEALLDENTGTRYLENLYHWVGTKIRRLEAILNVFGISVTEDAAPDSGQGVGGAFFPDSSSSDLTPVAVTSNFYKTFDDCDNTGCFISHIKNQFLILKRLSAMMTNLPIGTPIQNSSISSRYGKRLDPFHKRYAMHKGIDLVAPPRSSIHATGNGVVVHAGNFGAYGNTVIIDHGHNIQTLYAHMRRVVVHKGQHVSRGSDLGEIGNTGRSTGIHLHYEIKFHDKPVNPEKFMSLKLSAPKFPIDFKQTNG